MKTPTPSPAIVLATLALDVEAERIAQVYIDAIKARTEARNQLSKLDRRAYWKALDNLGILDSLEIMDED